MSEETLSCHDSLKIAEDGRAAWNHWAAKNPGRGVSFEHTHFHGSRYHDINFSGFIFPGNVNFNGVTFGLAKFETAEFMGDVEFVNSKFMNLASFKDAKFHGKCDFRRAQFDDDVGFQSTAFDGPSHFLATTFSRHLSLSGASFGANVNFLGATFLGSISFEGSSFAFVPDLRRSEFRKHVSLHKMSVEFRYPPEDGDDDKYRRLKELAVAARDHDKEQEFFAFELKAKRVLELSGFDWLVNLIYEITSDFGRSIWRPMGIFSAIWVYFGFHYTVVSDRVSELSRGLTYSINLLLPFLPGGLKRISQLEAELFNQDNMMALGAWPLIEGLLGVVFIFLIVLGIRNRFRI